MTARKSRSRSPSTAGSAQAATASDQALLDASLMRLGLHARDNCEVMRVLADLLYARGAVRAEYGDKVCERERSYPTGLPTAGVYVAIPHADAAWVNSSAIAVATLAEPVMFGNMADAQEQLPVEIVIMLAIADASKQVQMLQQVVKVISNEPMLRALKQATDPIAVAQTLREQILGQSGDAHTSA